jgi:endonuclease-3 related protein
MPRRHETADAIARALSDHYGPPAAHPGRETRDPFEALVATLLDRSLDPSKRDRALAALRDAGLLDAQALAEADPAETASELQSAGLKVIEKGVVPLRRVARWLVELHHGDAAALADPDGPVPTSQLREELTAVNGIGPATADALLLLALNRPVYPMDRATYRVAVRHGWVEPTADYDEARAAVEGLAPGDAPGLARLSAWFERVARDYCRVAAPRCDGCPLRPLLPPAGPIEPSG